MSEKIGGAKGSRLDEDFVELERVSFLLDIISFQFLWLTTLEVFHRFNMSNSLDCSRTSEPLIDVCL